MTFKSAARIEDPIKKLWGKGTDIVAYSGTVINQTDLLVLRFTES